MPLQVCKTQYRQPSKCKSIHSTYLRHNSYFTCSKLVKSEFYSIHNVSTRCKIKYKISRFSAKYPISWPTGTSLLHSVELDLSTRKLLYESYISGGWCRCESMCHFPVCTFTLHCPLYWPGNKNPSSFALISLLSSRSMFCQGRSTLLSHRQLLAGLSQPLLPDCTECVAIPTSDGAGALSVTWLWGLDEG